MNSTMRRLIFILLAAGVLAGGKISAQTRATASVRKSPVDMFRELLALAPDARAKALAVHPDHFRKTIAAKLAEYEALAPDERELRLQSTQLRWHLLPLMRMPPASRAARLAEISATDRPLVEERLALWDKLPADLQRDVLANETALLYLLRADAKPPLPPPLAALAAPDSIPRPDRALAAWQEIPAARRQEMLGHFGRFFELDEPEKIKTLETLSAAERREIEKSLRDFQQLPPQQRAICLRSFQQFASMSAEEQSAFLQNAERWKAMKPDERQLWRDLVSQLPPLPPGLGDPLMSVPIAPLTQATNR
ncbi:MAG: DUF3106 domain-containing protein [Verrucomicrobia bacterium]|nr:DUF3106 domain-containing protein [Verrucomicrobiota bacterium]